jgi:HEAT repeat protein
MGSRSPEDRKTIEASLMNLITAADFKPEDRRRARVALEEYGFVARHCATLLTGRDGWERASAARTLAQIGSQSSLPFLIEALHDDDSIVRNQAVASLASLKDPAAIGALLEAARMHPDVPASLLSETLSACSVDTLGPLDLPSTETALLSDVVEENKADTFQELAVHDDDVLSGWLEQLESADEKLDAVPDSLPPFTEAHERPYLTLVA